MSEREEIRRKVRELLVPGGEPIGEAGRHPDIRVLPGDIAAAREFLQKFRELGQVVAEAPANYPGEMVLLGSGDRVGLRSRSKSGEPTIDVTVEYVPEVRKIKFVLRDE